MIGADVIALMTERRQLLMPSMTVTKIDDGLSDSLLQKNMKQSRYLGVRPCI